MHDLNFIKIMAFSTVLIGHCIAGAAYVMMGALFLWFLFTLSFGFFEAIILFTLCLGVFLLGCLLIYKVIDLSIRIFRCKEKSLGKVSTKFKNRDILISFVSLIPVISLAVGVANNPFRPSNMLVIFFAVPMYLIFYVPYIYKLYSGASGNKGIA